MRIKNLTSNASNQGIICILALFLAFAAIDIAILVIVLNSGMTLGESFSWMFSSFCDADLGMKFVYLVLLIFPFFWLYLLVNELKVRIADDAIAYNSETLVKYVDFTDDKIKLSYLKSNCTKEIYYKNIDSIELVIDTCIAYNKYGPYSAMQGLYINIKSGSYSFSIHHAPVDLNKMYKVIYYSQYMKNFSYRFTGRGEQTKETLQKTIDDYITNGYKKTLRTNLYSPVNPIVLTIIFVSIITGWLFFILNLFK